MDEEEKNFIAHEEVHEEESKFIVHEEEKKFMESQEQSQKVYYLVKGRAIDTLKESAMYPMRTKIIKFEGPKDYIKQISNKIRLRPNLDNYSLFKDENDVWSKVISDGNQIVLYRGISNQVIDCIGQLALDGNITIRMTEGAKTFLKRLRYLIFMMNKDSQNGCIFQEFNDKIEAEEFFT